MSTAAELRAEADRLEQEEAVRAIEARCMSHGIEWSERSGVAYEVFGEFVPCAGRGGLSHYDTYEDEYGSRQSCPACNGSGKRFVTHRVRRPEYDAPRPEGKKLRHDRH